MPRSTWPWDGCYAAADEPRKALAISQAVLARDPGNLDARKAAIGAAIQASDWATRERAGARRDCRRAGRSADVGDVGHAQPRAWEPAAGL